MESESITLKVKEALSRIIDPETRLDVARMELVHDIQADEKGSVQLVFRPSSPICPMAYSLASSIRKEIMAIDGVTSIKLKVENFNKADHLESLINNIAD